MKEAPKAAALREILKGDDADARIDAARQLRHNDEPEGVALLLECLQDEDFELRLVAADSIGHRGVSEAEQLLLNTLFDEEWEVQWAAMRALGEIWDDSDIRKMGDKLPERRIAGLDSLGHRYEDRFLQPLLSSLDDELDEVRAAAVQALMNFGDPEAIPHLQELQEDGDVGFQAQVKEARMRLGDSSLAQSRQGYASNLACETCHQPLPYSFLKRVSAWGEEPSFLCQFHFEEYLENKAPFKGKFKACKMCKAHWPKIDLLEGICPSCRDKRYQALAPPGKGNFRCAYSHKVRPLRDMSPVSDLSNPLSSRSAYKIVRMSANPPYLYSRAVALLKKAWDEGYFLCEKRREFRPREELVEGEDFRDACLSKSAISRR